MLLHSHLVSEQGWKLWRCSHVLSYSNRMGLIVLTALCEKINTWRSKHLSVCKSVCKRTMCGVCGWLVVLCVAGECLWCVQLAKQMEHHSAPWWHSYCCRKVLGDTFGLVCWFVDKVWRWSCCDLVYVSSVWYFLRQCINLHTVYRNKNGTSLHYAGLLHTGKWFKIFRL